MSLEILSDSDLSALESWLREKEDQAKDALMKKVEKAQHPDAMVAEAFRLGGKAVAYHHLVMDVRRERESRSRKEKA